ncbi:hypothetical protein V8E52_011667, partial [Russula decolorans]
KKKIPGRYLGEILRLIICGLIDDGVLFLRQNTYKLEISYALVFALETTLAERQFFNPLAEFVGRCAARPSMCGTAAAIVSKMGYLESGCLVGADESL